jgi:hypothetical protein
MNIIVGIAQPVRERFARLDRVRGHPSATRNTRPQLIDVGDSDQMMHWSRYLGTTPLQLCNAIDKVGSNVTVVQRLLQVR